MTTAAPALGVTIRESLLCVLKKTVLVSSSIAFCGLIPLVLVVTESAGVRMSVGSGVKLVALGLAARWTIASGLADAGAAAREVVVEVSLKRPWLWAAPSTTVPARVLPLTLAVMTPLSAPV